MTGWLFHWSLHTLCTDKFHLSTFKVTAALGNLKVKTILFLLFLPLFLSSWNQIMIYVVTLKHIPLLRNCATYSTEIIKTCPDLTNRLMLMSSRILLNWSLKLHNSNRRPLSSFMHSHWCRWLNYFSRPEVTQCCWQDIVIQQLTDLFQSSSSNPMLLTGRCNLATNWPILIVLKWPNAVDRTL